MQIESTIRYLEMNDPHQLKPAGEPKVNARLEQVEVATPELNRFFYTAVGGDWFWTDRLDWSYQQWESYLENRHQQTWVVYAKGTPAGYFELLKENIQVELAYFGLLPQFTGLRLGGWLLSQAVKKAWTMDATRIWVHTCSEDHPNALANYLARGFKIFDEEQKLIQLPSKPTGPWIGSRN